MSTGGSPGPLNDLARLADELGPALAPPQHTKLLRSILDTARSFFGAAACSLALVDDSGTELQFHFASGVGADEVSQLSMPADRGIAGWVLATGQPIFLSNVAEDPRFAADIAQSTGYVPRSIIAAPLETEEAVIGVLEVLDPSQDPAGRERDMEQLGHFARQAAMAIDSMRIFSSFGRALLGVAADATHDPDLTSALRRAAQNAPGPNRDVAEFVARFHKLLRMGQEERRAVIQVIDAFLQYSQSVRSHR